MEFLGDGTECGNHVGIIRTVKNRRPRDKDVGPGFEHVPGVLDFDAAVHFKQGVAAGTIDELSGSPDFIQTGGDKGLSPESGIHRHDQHQVHVRDDFFNGAQGSRRVERDPGLDPKLFDALNRAVQVGTGFRMYRQIIGSGLGKVGNDGVRVRDHEMDVEWESSHFVKRFDNGRTDREVRHEMPVHHVHVQQVGSRGFHRGDFIGQVRKVRGESKGQRVTVAELIFYVRRSRAAKNPSIL